MPTARDGQPHRRTRRWAWVWLATAGLLMAAWGVGLSSNWSADRAWFGFDGKDMPLFATVLSLRGGIIEIEHHTSESLNSTVDMLELEPPRYLPAFRNGFGLVMLYVPLWTLATPPLLLGIFLLRHPRPLPARCSCGYSLAGLIPTNNLITCPECGTAHAPLTK